MSVKATKWWFDEMKFELDFPENRAGEAAHEKKQ